MKKTIIPCCIALVLFLSLPAHAAHLRSVRTVPSLSFSGTTATCSVSAYGENANDEIEVTLRLYRGLTLINTWTASGNGSVSMSKNATITPGATFQLTANVTINGGTPTSSSVSKYY